MLVGTSTYGAAGKFQRLPPINIQQHGKIRITLVCNDSWTVGCPKKKQKSEFWNFTYPSGFHRLDEPPEKISAL